MRECGAAMDHNTIQWLGTPCCLRGSFAFYKSFRCGAEPSEWRLGEFYFVRCGPQEPVCIAELTLLWEDQAQGQQLSSSRLYFLPEDTPKGRSREHGEDEVLAVSRKVVIRVEDLVRWSCPEPIGWKGEHQSCDSDTGQQAPFSGTGVEEHEQEKADCEPRSVKVLSYPQYCRFRSLQRRIQGGVGFPGPQEPHLLALGGIRVTHHNTRVLYCRDTFTHPTLDSDSSMWSELGWTSLSLKGRPRKRRNTSGRSLESKHYKQVDASWLERMKNSVMGSVEVSWEGGWLPHPEEQRFLDQLYEFMEQRGSPIYKVPNLGFKKIDLFLLFSIVKKLGGYERVTAQKLWKQVYNELGGSPGSTSAATCTRKHYERLILAYELHLKGEGEKPIHLPAPIVPSRNHAADVPHKKRRNGVLCPDGPVTSGRRRGRPPCRRHPKAPLINVGVGGPALKVKPEISAGGECGGSEEPSSTPLAQPKSEDGVKAAPGEPLPFPSLTVLPKLWPLGGLSRLDLFRTRLALSNMDVAGLQPQPVLQPSIVFLQPKGVTLENSRPSEVQLLGNGRPQGSSSRGTPSPGPLQPLKLIPIDLDCSLQVRQLMKGCGGSPPLSSFNRRLSGVLGRDRSPEPALPLNLSKRPVPKRPAEELDDSSPVHEQEEPADLSSPSRVRACPWEQTCEGGACGKVCVTPAQRLLEGSISPSQ